MPAEKVADSKTDREYSRPSYAVTHKKLSDLAPDSRNANKGTERGNAMIENSLRQYGAGRSILLDRNGRIIAGNKTAENAGSLGMNDVVVVQSDGTKLIAVQRMDLDLDDPICKQLAIADNRAGQVSLDWDIDTLKELALDGVDLAPFWSADELEAMWPQQVDLLTGEDDVPELPEEPVTKLGDLYVLGAHRLLCGDSTVATSVDRLLNGVSPLLMVTDPPYGVEYNANWRNEAMPEKDVPNRWKDGSGRAIGKVSNDSQADWTEAWALFPGRIAYVWHAGRHASVVQASLEMCGFAIRNQIIWAKSQFAISRGDYHWKHEPCWYAVKGKGNWCGDRSQTTLWNIDKPMKSETGHSTQKPVECMRRPIVNNSSAGQAVYDPFLGSGTTMIACETEGRACFGMELDPKYCDVIVQRWENATGKKAVLDGATA
jgi:DNA modification methylase